MSDRAFLENQKERLEIIKSELGNVYHGSILKLCNDSITDIDRYLERHKPPVEEYEHYRKEDI